MRHELKTDPKVFQDVWAGLKTYEIRKNDRNYEVGDCLILKETEYTGLEMTRSHSKPLIFTGREILAEAIHILYGPMYGLEKGWCIISIQVRRRDTDG